MNGAVLAIAFVLGIVLLAGGLVLVIVPLTSNASISLPWLIVGGLLLVAGALLLWLVRTEATFQATESPSQGNRAFFTVLGIVNLIVFALSVRQGEWHSAAVAFAAAGIVVLLVKLLMLLMRNRRPK